MPMLSKDHSIYSCQWTVAFLLARIQESLDTAINRARSPMFISVMTDNLRRKQTPLRYFLTDAGGAVILFSSTGTRTDWYLPKTSVRALTHKLQTNSRAHTRMCEPKRPQAERTCVLTDLSTTLCIFIDHKDFD